MNQTRKPIETSNTNLVAYLHAIGFTVSQHQMNDEGILKFYIHDATEDDVSDFYDSQCGENVNIKRFLDYRKYITVLIHTEKEKAKYKN